ncbi:DUF3592 domain-containing protein [Streptomyces sp. NPDC056149]|uniref:DUF3592 domain-containing protein n=1 Tax=Streptomyces sp. NPDC056149 TaxID=3345728 RepID=UPI0035DBFE02
MGPIAGAVSVMAFGSVFGGAGAGSLYKRRSLRRNGSRTSGTVIRLDRSSSGEGTSYHPAVQYRTDDGQLVETRSSFGTSRSARLRPGTPVAVFYDPAKPQRMAIDGYAGGSALAFCVFGAVTFAGGALLLWSKVR